MAGRATKMTAIISVSETKVKAIGVTSEPRSANIYIDSVV
jgi:hypothetical protein